jgi:hypothetical protein
MKTLFLSALLISVAHASPITWGPRQNISFGADVSMDGTLVGAFNLGPTTTVSGVTFNTLPLSGNFSLTSWDGIYQNGGGGVDDPNHIGPFYGLEAGYQTLLSTYMTRMGGFATLTMGGLTPGSSYQFQWWSHYSRNGGYGTYALAGNQIYLSSSGPEVAQRVYGLGQFAIGSFTADAAGVQTIDFGGGGPWIVNGFQLRETSSGQFATAAFLSASPVPESGATWLLLALPLLGLLFVGRKLT